MDKLKKYHHRFDGILTKNNDEFRKAPLFEHAYATAVKASGEDYGVPWRLHQALWATHSTAHLSGDLVELGTGRGFIMSGVLAAYDNWSNSGKSAWLVDTFMSQKPDEKTGEQSTSGQVSRYYAISYEHTRRQFEKYENVNLIRGVIPHCLDSVNAAAISFLHIDLNHHLAEVSALRLLWDRVQGGGIVILDDYANGPPGGKHQQQYESMNALSLELGFHILTTPTGQGLVVKADL